MVRITPDGEQSHGSRRIRDHARADAHAAHPVLNLGRPFVAVIPDSSVSAVHKVARLDGRTRIIGGREPGGRWWKLRHRLRFTRAHARELREAGVSEVILKRGLSRASFPLAWLSNRQS